MRENGGIAALQSTSDPPARWFRCALGDTLGIQLRSFFTEPILMHTFFHGWRRKAGSVTLLLACAVYGAWIRSSTVTDSVNCYSWWKVTQSLVSSDSSLSWERRDTTNVANHEVPFWKRGIAGRKRRAPRALPQLASFQSESIIAGGHLSPRLDAPDIIWHWRWHGFGSGDWPSHYTTLWVIPYWSIVLPLTLLSAYLILWKPRKPTQCEDRAGSRLSIKTADGGSVSP
jgi:hypothetical protein